MINQEPGPGGCNTLLVNLWWISHPSENCDLGISRMSCARTVSQSRHLHYKQNFRAPNVLSCLVLFVLSFCFLLYKNNGEILWVSDGFELCEKHNDCRPGQAGWRQSLWKVMNLWMNCSGKGSIKMWVSLYALGGRRKKLGSLHVKRTK